MTRFVILDQQQKAERLPALFDLLYENMKNILPADASYEQQRSAWLAEVSTALEKAPRKMVLCYSGDELTGFAQYYTRENLLMIEEIQLKAAYQRTMMFGCLCRYIAGALPERITVVEAYADAANRNSRRIMEKLGMQVISDETPPQFVHLRGDAQKVKNMLRI